MGSWSDTSARSASSTASAASCGATAVRRSMLRVAMA
jgi:hypothetical protein